MSSIEGDYVALLREIANNDLANGDFVTASRIEYNSLVYEHLVTFSGIEIKRRMLADAYHAKTKESSEDFG